MSRIDLTNWIIHFVHDRIPENNPNEIFYNDVVDEPIEIPTNFDYEGKPIYQTYQYEEDDYPIEDDAYVFTVLKKILYDGIIKTGWSFRKGHATIYGPKSAVCFTEMPLYALIEYSKTRSYSGYIAPYGIAFLKEELFTAGARPVIYGLSGNHSECEQADPYFGIGFRTLSKNCGIGLKEMYRYVYTNIKLTKKVDWTHEREWRWADLDDEFYFAGLPFYAENNRISFSKIIVFVQSNDEVLELMDHLQHLHHSESTNMGRAYYLNTIENTYVLAIDDLQRINKNISTIKFDDLPLHSIKKLEKIIVRKEVLEKVRIAIDKASEIYYAETDKRFKENGDRGPCGWANIETYEPNSEITQALIDLNVASSFGKGYYVVRLSKSYPCQSIDIDEPGKILAAKFLSEELGQNFGTVIVWD